MREKKKKTKLIWTTVVVLIFFTLVFFGMLVVFSYSMGYVSLAPEKTNLGFKVYHSKKLGIEFKYRDMLKVREESEAISLEHAISFEHVDPCGRNFLLSGKKSKEVLDFYIRLSVINKSPVEIFVQNLLVIDKGVAVGLKRDKEITYGELAGFRVYNGNSNCGFYSYFFRLTNKGDGRNDREQYLRVDRYPAPEFNELPEAELQVLSRLREVILPENEEHFFKEILTSLKWNLK